MFTDLISAVTLRDGQRYTMSKVYKTLQLRIIQRALAGFLPSRLLQESQDEVVGMRITSIGLAILLAAAIAQPAMAKNKYDSTPLFQSVDTDKDGKISLAEWKAVDLPEMVFNALDQSHDGFITKDEFDGSQAPDGLDKNHDGKLTLEAFKEHVKAMSAGGGGGQGGPGGPGGAPPSGSAPPDGGGAPPAQQ